MRIVQELLGYILMPIIWVFYIITLFIVGTLLIAFFFIGLILQFGFELVSQLPKRK